MIALAFMNLFRNVRRTLAILLTIAMGCAVLFSFKGFIHGVLNQYKESTIHAHYGHGQIHTKGYRDNLYVSPIDHWIDLPVDFSPFEEVTDLFPRISFPAVLTHGQRSFSGLGEGIAAQQEAAFFHGLNIEQGKSLTSEPDGILLGKGLAHALGVDVGDKVELLGRSFTVTGIFHTGSLDFDSRMFRIQLDRAKELLHTNRVESIALGLREDADWNAFKEAFEEAYPHLEATSFAILDQVYYQHSVNWLNSQFSVIQIIILSIVLLGIFNSISSAILERKQEIGNFRANGESIKDILKLVTLEGALKGLLGSSFGILAAYLVMTFLLDQGIEMPPGPGLTRPFLISFKFQWDMVYSTLVLCSISAILASFLAALRVVKMPIAKLLRSY